MRDSWPAWIPRKDDLDGMTRPDSWGINAEKEAKGLFEVGKRCCFRAVSSLQSDDRQPRGVPRLGWPLRRVGVEVPGMAMDMLGARALCQESSSMRGDSNQATSPYGAYCNGVSDVLRSLLQGQGEQSRRKYEDWKMHQVQRVMGRFVDGYALPLLASLLLFCWIPGQRVE